MGRLQKKWISDDAIDGSKIKLNNNENFRARNFADTADLALFSVDTTNSWNFTLLPETAIAPTLSGHLTNKTYVDAQINALAAGITWKESVLDSQTTPPGSPSTGDRYVVTATATGAWAGQENDIAEWNGSSWDFITPNNGDAVIDVSELSNGFYIFNGSSWSFGQFESTVGGVGTTLNGNAIDVNYDDTTIGLTGNSLQVKDNGITEAKINNDAVTTDKIANNSITEAKLQSTIDAETFDISTNYGSNISAGSVGSGDSIEDAIKKLEGQISGGQSLTSGAATTINGSAIDVDVDDSTIEIATDALQVKDLGITNAKLGADSVNADKIADDAITEDHISSLAVKTAAIDNGAVTEAKLGSDIDTESFLVATGYDSSTASGNVAAGIDLQTALERIEKKADDASASGNTNGSENITLSGTDISNGYVEISQPALANSVNVYAGGLRHTLTTDYSLSTPVTNTRITFAGDLASTLASGDVLSVTYQY